MKGIDRIKAAVACLTILFGATVGARTDPTLKWKVITTKAFKIYYHEGAWFTAHALASIADKYAEKVLSQWGEKLPSSPIYKVVIRDTDDIANAHARYDLEVMDFYATASTSPLRGRRNWIIGTFPHEFAHIVSLKRNSSTGRLIGGLSFGGIEDRWKDTHLDYGGSVYIPSSIYWRWWAEATAQIDAMITGGDPWDTSRDMVLRTALFDNGLLSWDEMHSIHTTKGFGGELVYNQGFSFLDFLESEYGPHFRVREADRQSRKWYGDADAAIEALTDKSGYKLYKEWIKNLKRKYSPKIDEIQKNKISGKRVDVLQDSGDRKRNKTEDPYKDGLYISHPRFSKDGRWLTWSDRGTIHLMYLQNHFSPPLTDDHTEKGKRLSFSISFEGTTYALSPSANTLVVSKKRSKWNGSYLYYDLFVIDLSHINKILTTYENLYADSKEHQKLIKKTKKMLLKAKTPEKKLTYGLRATHPAFSPDGKKLIFSVNKDGNRSLYIMDFPSGKPLLFLKAENGAQYINAVFTKDGKQIIFGRFGDVPQSIWGVDLNGENLSCVVCDREHDYRDPLPCDKNKLFLSSDRTGIFNIYEFDLKTKKLYQLTNITTGAFHPYPDNTCKKILYSEYTAFGFKTAFLEVQKKIDAGKAPLYVPKSYTFNTKTNFKETDYVFELLPPLIHPSIILEDNFFKAGFTANIRDVLGMHSLLLYTLFGKDSDLSASYTARTSFADLSLSFSRYTRESDIYSEGSLPVSRDYILKHYQASLSLPLYSAGFAPGSHYIGITYHKKDYDLTYGIPVSPGSSSPSKKFSLLENDRFSIWWKYNSKYDYRDPLQDIIPRNRRMTSIKFTTVHSKINPDLSSDPATARSYSWYNEIKLSHREFISVPWSSLQAFELSLKAGYINKNVDPLDEFYAGGRLQFRTFGDLNDNDIFLGYEDFSISGETLIMARAAFHFPIASEIHKKIWATYIDSIFASVFFDAGNAWDFGKIRNRSDENGDIILYDTGLELRMKSFIFSDYNKFNGILQIAYGFQDSAGHGFKDNDWPIRIYAGIGVDF